MTSTTPTQLLLKSYSVVTALMNQGFTLEEARDLEFQLNQVKFDARLDLRIRTAQDYYDYIQNWLQPHLDRKREQQNDQEWRQNLRDYIDEINKERGR